MKGVLFEMEGGRMELLEETVCRNKANFQLVRGVSDEATLVLSPAPHRADEVLCAALVKLMGRPVRILRTNCRNKAMFATKLSNAMVVNVGWVVSPKENWFCSRSNEMPERADGVRMSAFGQMWDKFGEELLGRFGCPKELLETADTQLVRSLVENVDALCNEEGVAKVTLSRLPEASAIGVMTLVQALELFNPVNGEVWSEAETNAKFLMACELGLNILERAIRVAIAEAEAWSSDDSEA